MITVIDYKMGNIHSVQKALEYVGFQVKVTNSYQEIVNSKGVVLPGVGAFRDAMRNIKELNIDKAIYKVIEEGKPFLGICLGLQLLFSKSYEEGEYQGLDIFKGKVVKFSKSVLIPHIGWNTVVINHQSDRIVSLFKDIPDNSFFYFVHSYFVKPDNENIIATTTNYDLNFTSTVVKDNIVAFQFHPEKSQDFGLKLLENYKNMFFNSL
ncbi:MAG: imidazole glycerol phosphate synthase subunit HisH [bacterium]|nr:imidazole glycerol phosphate synthase subunit HisH [bacterium]